jgi:hypothetical protein
MTEISLSFCDIFWLLKYEGSLMAINIAARPKRIDSVTDGLHYFVN